MFHSLTVSLARTWLRGLDGLMKQKDGSENFAQLFERSSQWRQTVLGWSHETERCIFHAITVSLASLDGSGARRFSDAAAVKTVGGAFSMPLLSLWRAWMVVAPDGSRDDFSETERRF